MRDRDQPSYICKPSRLLVFLTILWLPAAAQNPPGIQDNSFLIEEAYNQDRGVVQHISTFSRMWNSKDWAYTFTQEWAAPGHPRHQLSYTLIAAHAGAFGPSSGWGDTILNYRWQMAGNGEARTAFSPRLSLLVPSGNVAEGRGSGAVGFQTSLPVSVVLSPRLVSHWNAGATFVAHAQNAVHEHADTAGYNLGQSFIWLAHPRFNILMETEYTNSQSVVGRRQTGWQKSVYFSPGIRWAYNFHNSVQIVTGVGIPLGIGPSFGEKGVFLYFSVEHPLPGRRPE